MAGYSRRPLVAKLGIKPGTRIAVVNAPRGYGATLGKLPKGVRLVRAARGTLPFIQFFTKRTSELEAQLGALKEALSPDGALWISWPKGASNVPTDVNENVVRAIALAHGLVDVKVAAVDETWSGLKLVRRVKDRQ